MKYLKLFEKQDIDSYYVQITNSEFDNKVREADIGDQGYKAGYIGDHWEEFTNREYDEISSLVNNIPDIEYLSNLPDSLTKLYCYHCGTKNLNEIKIKYPNMVIYSSSNL